MATIIGRCLAILAILALIVSCALDDVIEGNGSSSLAPTVLWKRGAVTVNPDEVDSVRVSIISDDIANQVEKFAFADSMCTFPSLPRGITISVKIEGIDAGGVVVYEGIEENIDLDRARVPVIIEAHQVTPISPFGAAVTALSHKTIRVTWTECSTNETKFVIHRDINDGAYDSVAVVVQGRESFTDTGLTAETTYRYRIYAWNAAGLSLQYSQSDTVTTLAEGANSQPYFSDETRLGLIDDTIPVGKEYSSYVEAMDDDGGDLEISHSGELTLTGNTITWTPGADDTGLHDMWIAVVDTGGLSDTVKWTLLVTDTVTSDLIDLVFVQGGTFQMGSEGKTQLERPVHEVTVSSFYMMTTEVTQALYESVMGSNPSTFNESPMNPVDGVTWYDAVLFCNALSKTENLDTYYAYDTSITGAVCDLVKNGYRLPTEAEWEYACRAGTSTQYYWGDESDTVTVSTNAWCLLDSDSKTHPVREKTANPLGLYDLSGNVWEWCYDCIVWYDSATQCNPTGPDDGGNRILRGGGYASIPSYIRSTYRFREPPDEVNSKFGFRVVKSQELLSTIAPSVIVHPASQTVNAGSSVEFSIAATGTTPDYQWQKDSVDIDGATDSSYSISSVSASDAGSYRCVVQNAAGSDTSNAATLAVTSGSADGTVTDADGNVYTTVIIGNQEWTTENLRTTKYNDGTDIPYVPDGVAWSGLSTPGYCYYKNLDSAAQVKWGALYNWHAVNTGKLAPTGWRVPTDADWTDLENFLIANGYNYDGTTTGNKIAKSLAAKTDWATFDGPGAIGNDLSANNSTGFSALPGGFRRGDGGFYGQSDYGYWWSATETDASTAYDRYLRYDLENLERRYGNKENGFSVRLVRD